MTSIKKEVKMLHPNVAAHILITFLICLLAFPAYIKSMRKWKANQIIREEGPESHKEKIGTPTMGGLLVIISVIINLIICGNFSNLYILIILFFGEGTIIRHVLGFFGTLLITNYIYHLDPQYLTPPNPKIMENHSLKALHGAINTIFDEKSVLQPVISTLRAHSK